MRAAVETAQGRGQGHGLTAVGDSSGSALGSFGTDFSNLSKCRLFSFGRSTTVHNRHSTTLEKKKNSTSFFPFRSKFCGVYKSYWKFAVLLKLFKVQIHPFHLESKYFFTTLVKWCLCSFNLIIIKPQSL